MRAAGTGTMKITIAHTTVAEVEADLLICAIAGEARRDANLQRLDALLKGDLAEEAERSGFTDGTVRECLFQTHGRLRARYVLLASCDAELSAATCYGLAERVARASDATRAERIALALPPGVSAEVYGAVVEGILLARYRFSRFQSKRPDRKTLSLRIIPSESPDTLRSVLDRRRVMAEATCYARDLANTPAGVLTPAAMVKEARKLVPHVKVTIHDRRALRRLGMGAVLGVGAGSKEKPYFIEMVYRPARNVRRRIALVGKGITFDSGGLSLKSADAMKLQKRDMAGGAVVLAVMRALPHLRPNVEVRGYIPVTENMPGGAAMKPGDVLYTHSGKTVEVLNTDAEGRLVLADALSYAASKKPDEIIDFATLTAAVRLALGGRYAAIMGTSASLVSAFIAAGADVAERLWELPLVDDYHSDIESRVADLKNVGEGQAGTIIGGLFLREFVGSVPWAHIDFSSTVMSDGYACHPAGASGFGVRTALRYLLRRGEEG
jgi:leucyl aminopeptidase